MKRGDRLDNSKLELIKIHKDDIAVCEYDYIQSLPDESLIYKKSNIFLGLLESIYQNVLSKYFIDTDSFNNDYEMLDIIFFKIYLPIVLKYGYTPSLYMFSSFIHSNNNYFTELLNGTYRDGSKVNNATTVTVRKWYNVCKAATITRAIDDNSIGAIFASKAAYGMTDTPTPAIEAKQDDDIVDISFLSSDQDKNSVPVLHPID